MKVRINLTVDSETWALVKKSGLNASEIAENSFKKTFLITEDKRNIKELEEKLKELTKKQKELSNNIASIENKIIILKQKEKQKEKKESQKNIDFANSLKRSGILDEVNFK